MNNIPHREIAKALNVTRQHVSALVKKGLPTSSLDAARGWYLNNVRSRSNRLRRRPGGYSIPTTITEEWDALPLELQPCSFGLEEIRHTPRPIKLVELDHLKPVLTDEEVDEWMDREVETVEDCVRLSAFLIQILRLYIDWMPHVMAERVNPIDPEYARRELEHWVETMDRECFTDGNEKHKAGGK